MNLWAVLIAIGVIGAVLIIKDGLNAFKYFEDLEDEGSEDGDSETNGTLSDGKRVAKPSQLSPEAQAARSPRPPEELVGALQDRTHLLNGRLLSAKQLKSLKRKDEDTKDIDVDNKLNDMFGSWPGEETDDEIAAALRDENIQEATKEVFEEDKDLLNRLKDE